MVATHMNQREYAEYQHVSKQAVTAWKQKGLILFARNGLIDVAATDRQLRGHFGMLPRNKVTSTT